MLIHIGEKVILIDKSCSLITYVIPNQGATYRDNLKAKLKHILIFKFQ